MLKLFGNSEKTQVIEKSDIDLLSRLMDRDGTQPHIQQFKYFTELKHGLKQSKASKEEKQIVERAITRVRAILSAFDAGFEPCTPPDWYCGAYGKEVIYWHNEVFPRKRTPLEETALKLNPNRGFEIWQYRGVVPPEIQPKWQLAKSIFGAQEIRIYSPDVRDFIVARVITDPIMIGRVVSEDTAYYFRIGHWDLENDFEHMKKFENKQAN